MNKKTWDLYAPIYKRAMKADQKIYNYMYRRIPERIRDKEVLEIATGPGLLIAPNFVEHKGTLISRIWSGILVLAGVRFEHQWSAEEYLAFLRKNGWKVIFKKEMAARIALMFTECRKKQGIPEKY